MSTQNSTATPSAEEDTSVDHAALQAALTARYQAALKRAGGDRAAVDDDGRQALADLVEDLTPLLYKVLREKIRKRFPHSPPDGLVEECYAEMVATVVEAAATFDPKRCPAFYSWVTGKQGAARAALNACLMFAAGHDGLDQRALRALKIADRAETELSLRLGRTPTTPEIQQEMLEYCVTYQYDRLTDEQRQLPEPEWQAIVRAKLRNSSMLANIRDIGELRQAAARAVSPEEFATGWDHLDSDALFEASADVRVADAFTTGEAFQLADVAVAGMSSQDKLIAFARLAGHDDGTRSLAAVAERFRVPVARVKEIVNVATSRVGAAHAHYSFLAPGISGQFEEAPAPAAGGVESLLAGLRTALV